MSAEQVERHPRRWPHDESPEYPKSVREIRLFTWWIWVWALGFAGLSWWLWSVRIDDYYRVALAAAEKSAKAEAGGGAYEVSYGYWDAFHEIMVVAGGQVPLLLNVICILVMVWFWRGFHVYLVHVCEGIPKDAKKPTLNPRELRRLAALHEPAGDIFTLVGIAFTFLGLAVSMLTISAEIIQSLADQRQVVGRSLAQSAIVFGSSLGIGLVGSLFGVGMAIHARWIAAQCCPDVPSAWHTANAIDHLHSMPKLLGRAEDAPPPLDADQLAAALVRALADSRAFADIAEAAGRLNAAAAEMKQVNAVRSQHGDGAAAWQALEAPLALIAEIQEAVGDTRSTLKKRLPVNLGVEIKLQLESAVALLLQGLKEINDRREDPDPAPSPPPPPGPPSGGSGGRRGRRPQS